MDPSAISGIGLFFWCQANGPSPQTNLVRRQSLLLLFLNKQRVFQVRNPVVTSHTGRYKTSSSSSPDHSDQTIPGFRPWPGCPSPTVSLTTLTNKTVSGKVFFKRFLRTTSFFGQNEHKSVRELVFANKPTKIAEGSTFKKSCKISAI